MDLKSIELPTITCRECGAENSISDALSDGVIENLVQFVSDGKKAEFEQAWATREAELTKAIRVEEKEETKVALKGISDDLKEAMSAKLTLQSELTRLKTKLEVSEENRQAEIQVAVDAEKQRFASESALKERQKDEEIDRLKKSITELKMTTNPGSSQLTGESGELLIEDQLRHLFPLDLVQEIKKGQSGADCLWTLRARNGGELRSIYIESKVTQNFQSSWVEKFKEDMVEKGASVGIIVTKTMPKDNDVCHLREGVFICGFHEFETLAKALRHGQLEVARAKNQELVKEGKAQELFDFVVGNEFSSIMEKILRPIFEQQDLLEREKRSLTRSWKAREKHIKKSVDGAGLLAGQLEAILGASVVNQIGFENYDALELLEDENDEK